MASNIETGHGVNISNFKLLLDKCAVVPSYNPSNTDLTVANMTLLWQSADNAHQTLITAVAQAKDPINQRELLFKPLDKLVTRTLNFFESTKANKSVKKDAKGLADKIRGFNTKIPKLPDGTPDPAHVSQAHLSYVQKQLTFKQLLDLYTSDPLYAPNEVEVNIATLQTLHTNMKNANDNIGTIIAPVQSARVTRDNALYKADTGIVDVALACKDYIISLLGARKPETKLFTSIKFTRPRKKSSQ
ncbi:MAG: hypothetical protein POELPBGB_00529 [Bacteroidia bacterium]|nr:hypothetical protein [Bacteroidia bacterium]